MRTNKVYKVVPRTKQNLFSDNVLISILVAYLLIVGLSGCASKRIYCGYEQYGNERVWACEKK